MTDAPDAAPPRPTLLLVTADLFLGSRLRGVGEAAGYAARTAAPARAADVAAERVVFDLTAPGLDLPALLTGRDAAKIAAYAPHIRVDLLKAARAAGLSAVFTRGQLESALPRWLAE